MLITIADASLEHIIMSLNLVLFWTFISSKSMVFKLVMKIKNYYLATDEITGFFLLLKNHIFIAHSEDTFLSFTCEDIGVTMVTNMISQLQESFPLRKKK